MRARALLLLACLVGMSCTDSATDPQVRPRGAPSFARVHFIGDATCTQIGSNLVCDFKIAGLGNISSATVEVQAPFTCTKTNGGQQFVQPGGLASGSQSNVPVSNGQITVSGFVVSGGRSCPDGFGADFGGVATVFINGVSVGTIPIT
jgi:hypothetical protein